MHLRNPPSRPALSGASSLLSAYEKSHHETVMANFILPLILHAVTATFFIPVFSNIIEKFKNL